MSDFKKEISKKILGNLTLEQAMDVLRTEWWENPAFTEKEVAELQLQQTRLVMKFSEFHRLVEKLLGRSVWTHEFALKDALLKEWRGGRYVDLPSQGA